MPIQKASHCAQDFSCAYDLHYHFNFSVKYRRAVLEPDVVRELVRISLEIQERYEIEIECLGADKDHIHLVCATRPSMAPSRIAQVYKSLTARELYAAMPNLRKRLWGGEFWGVGYFVETVAQRGTWESLVRYVERQGAKPEGQNLSLWYEANP